VNRKREVLEAVLSRSWAFVQLDGTRPGVELPEWLRTTSVTLQLGYDMPVPIDDLVVDDAGVCATLSFRRTPHLCRVPWPAVFAIFDDQGRGALFAEDMPAGLSIAPIAPIAPGAAPEAAPEAPPAPADRMKNGKPRPAHLKLV